MDNKEIEKKVDEKLEALKVQYKSKKIVRCVCDIQDIIDKKSHSELQAVRKMKFFIVDEENKYKSPVELRREIEKNINNLFLRVDYNSEFNFNYLAAGFSNKFPKENVLNVQNVGSKLTESKSKKRMFEVSFDLIITKDIKKETEKEIMQEGKVVLYILLQANIPNVVGIKAYEKIEPVVIDSSPL